MAQILITRPEHDPLTRHLSYWNTKIIEIAKKKGFDVIDLHQRKANRKDFEGRIKKVNPALVLLNGHGDNFSVCGHDNEVLVKLGKNEKLLQNRITYAVSCSSAKRLGVKVCVKDKASFIGYKDYFILNIDRNFLTHPLKDKRAERFLTPSNKVGISLIKGHTCEEAAKNSQEAFRENIILLLANSSNPNDLDDAKDLFWDMNHQVCLGKRDARI